MLVDFLCTNSDMFAWSPLDTPGIPREVVEHSFDIQTDCKPVKPQLRHFDEDRRRAIREEIHK
jgi:hypothetical protein